MNDSSRVQLGDMFRKLKPYMPAGRKAHEFHKCNPCILKHSKIYLTSHLYIGVLLTICGTISFSLKIASKGDIFLGLDLVFPCLVVVKISVLPITSVVFEILVLSVFLLIRGRLVFLVLFLIFGVGVFFVFVIFVLLAFVLLVFVLLVLLGFLLFVLLVFVLFVRLVFFVLSVPFVLSISILSGLSVLSMFSLFFLLLTFLGGKPSKCNECAIDTTDTEYVCKTMDSNTGTEAMIMNPYKKKITC